MVFQLAVSSWPALQHRRRRPPPPDHRLRVCLQAAPPPADAVDPAGSAANDDEGTSVHVGLLASVIVSLVLCIGVIVVIRRRSTAGSVSRQKWEQANRSAGSNVASPDFQFSQLSGGQQYSNSAYAGGAGDIYRTGGQQAAGDAAINADDPSWPDHAPQSSSI